VNRRNSVTTLIGLLVALVLAGCGVTKEDFLGPELNRDYVTSNQQLIMSAARTPSFSELNDKGYQAVEIDQSGDDHMVAFAVCGDKNIVDCTNDVQPTSDLPYVMVGLAERPTDATVPFAGASYLLYPAGPTHNEHYSVRCDVVTTASTETSATGVTSALVNDLAELGVQVADKVAPIEITYDQPVTNLTVNGNTYACVLAYEPFAGLN
jgi:hypothetical protein